MRRVGFALALSFLPLTGISFCQDSPPERPERDGPPGGGRGPGGPGDEPEQKLVDQFDVNKNGRLETNERSEARAFLKANPKPARRGGPRPPDQGELEIKPGMKIKPEDIQPSRGDLYAESTLRTLFIDFESDDWESELEDFNNTDVDVPATLVIDGEEYPGVGLHFRGKSSYFKARTGQKRSLNLSLDHSDDDQRLHGYKTLNLNNSFGDASLIGAAVYSHIARSLIPAPKVNLVRVVINGEDWGIYQNQQQFDKDFLKENFDTKKGARWKAPGSPNGKAGLEYLGEEVEKYEKLFEMKQGDDEDLEALIALTKLLNETPADELEATLAPILDIEGVLRFLALDCVLMNSDGYWTRASDYYVYRDPKGVFHVVPHDMNESFRGSRGRRTPRGEASAETASPFGLDPLVGLDDDTKPLRSKLLAVPALRQRYLEHVEAIARDWLDWEKLGPLVASYRALIVDEVALDTRKNGTTEAFLKLTSPDPAKGDSSDSAQDPPRDRRASGRSDVSFRTFAEGRRDYLLQHPAIAGSTGE